MDFFELLAQRRACHHFRPNQKIPKEDFFRMVEAASLTPSGYNAQPWEFVIITEQKNVSKVAEIAFGQEHIADASALIVVLGDLNIGRHADEILKDWVKYGYRTEEEVPAYRNSMAKVRSPEKRTQMALRNAMLASMTLIFAAEAMGYSTCPIMGFSPWQLEEFIGMPEDRCIALLIAIGTGEPDKEKPRLPRKEAEAMIHWEKF